MLAVGVLVLPPALVIEPWPGGRSNHYLFDMNRDWFAQSQLETRGRTAFYLQWFPQVVVDLHAADGAIHSETVFAFAPARHLAFATAGRRGQSLAGQCIWRVV